MEGTEEVVYISGQEAARRLGVSPITISRVTRKSRIGIFVEDGRLAAVSVADLPRLRSHIHATPGNPVWIAAGAEKRKRPVARRKKA